MDNDAAVVSPHQAEIDQLLAELQEISKVMGWVDKAKARRLEVWLRLRELEVTQARMAEVSGMTPVSVCLALQRHDRKHAESIKQPREEDD